jgi:hypothetical protein
MADFKHKGNINITDGKITVNELLSESGLGKLSLEFQSENELLLSNKGGTFQGENLFLSPGYVELSSYDDDYGYVGIYTNNSTLELGDDFVFSRVSNPVNFLTSAGFFTQYDSYEEKYHMGIGIQTDVRFPSTYSMYCEEGKTTITTPLLVGGKTTSAIIKSYNEINECVIDLDYRSGITMASSDDVGTAEDYIGVVPGSVVMGAGEIELSTIKLFFKSLPTHPNNADAIANGLTIDQVYKTSTGELRIVV